MKFFQSLKSKSKDKDKKEIHVQFEDSLGGRQSKASSNKTYESGKYSSDPSGPPNFGGNLGDSDRDLNDRSMNARLSYPTDVRGRYNDISGDKSGSDNSGRPTVISHFQQSNKTDNTVSQNKSISKFLNRNANKEMMSPILTSQEDELSAMDPRNLTNDTKEGTSMKKTKGVSPLNLSKLNGQSQDPRSQSHVQQLQGELVRTQEENDELFQQNRALQQHFYQMKEDNEKMKEHLDFIVKGGDPKKLEQRMIDGLFDQAEPSQFQTPQINNVFDQYSDFQQSSAGVRTFRYDGTDEQLILRSFLFKDDTHRSKTFGVKPQGLNSYQTPDKRRPEKFKSTPMKHALNQDEIGNSYKNSNLPVSPDVIKNNDLNKQAFSNDYGTSYSYNGSEKEPYAIQHIKEKVVRKSTINQTDPRSVVYRRFDPLQSNKDDIIKKARTSILHEDDDEIFTSRAEALRNALRQGSKVAPPPPPERDYSDKQLYRNMLQSSIERKSTFKFAQKNGTKEASALDDIIQDYCRQTSAGEKSVQDHIAKLRFVASDVYAHEKIPVKKMKKAILEKYIDQTVKLGMYDPEQTDLNFSPEGKIRRDWLYHLDDKEQEAQNFVLASTTMGHKENQDPNTRSRKSSAYRSSDIQYTQESR